MLFRPGFARFGAGSKEEKQARHRGTSRKNGLLARIRCLHHRRDLCYNGWRASRGPAAAAAACNAVREYGTALFRAIREEEFRNGRLSVRTPCVGFVQTAKPLKTKGSMNRG